jgi:hypothetical protein
MPLACGNAFINLRLPNQIAIATPAMMQSAYAWIESGPTSMTEKDGVGIAERNTYPSTAFLN